mmetsp:Transcript_4585/g.10483  ORF Transcript_4585/g.10483 Transcript_4585/m.10483 type:complete len:291 (+) Transcript_4585:283-1155(+)
MILDNSNCLVVGATNPSSIGFYAACHLLKAGARHVTIVGRDKPKLDESLLILSRKIVEMKLTNKSVSGVLGDLKIPETMHGVVEEAKDLMGGIIDILVCCGANGYSEYLGLDAKDPESYRTMQNVAVLSPMFLAEASFPYLSKSTNEHGGTVVMVGSVAADVPWPDTAPYNFAMAAKNTMTQTLAFKYRNDNVRVNGVQAGIIHTGALEVMARKKNTSVESYAALRATAQPLGRNGTPDDVANAVLYLASPASGFTTGELLRVDGGLHLSNWWNQQKNAESIRRNKERRE